MSTHHHGSSFPSSSYYNDWEPSVNLATQPAEEIPEEIRKKEMSHRKRNIFGIQNEGLANLVKAGIWAGITIGAAYGLYLLEHTSLYKNSPRPISEFMHRIK